MNTNPDPIIRQQTISAEEIMPIQASKHVFVLDCPDAPALAEFYSRLLGWEMGEVEDGGEWVVVKPTNAAHMGFQLAFQQIENYRAPEWPEGEVPQQAHLDFQVPSFTDATRTALSLGATEHPKQPDDSDAFAVFLDPAGHPFCMYE